ncbi:MAG TPA: hypothetical protein VFV42_07025 [Acidimicrobiales bacterium]|nr:hypothetical protein [Acidimicrobiales bacterium]
MTMLEERTMTSPATPVDRPIPVTRRRIDHLLIAAGVLAAVVLAIAGGLLTWGSNFAEDYVGDELAAQNIEFPPSEALVEEGRDDLAEFGGQQVDTGEEAEAYASYIQGHVDDTAGGLTYSQIPDRAARTALQEAIDAGAPADEIAELEQEATTLSQQRDTVFKGEMLRGTLLNAYAWSTMGRIAGIAATAAFAAAAVMAVLSVAGVVHLRKVTH